jgi:hypothetical protein
MTEMMRQRLWLLAFLALCCAGTALAGYEMRNIGDAASLVDRGSEANAYREVDGFRSQGFFHDYGLGNVLFGTSYPHEGFVTNDPADRAHMVTPSGVYTHYPPGPEYILYVEEAIFGPKPVWRLRFVPLVFCGAAAVFFGFSVRRRFGARVGWLVMLACAMVIPFHDANTSFHCLGYALALLLIEIGLAIGRQRSRVPFILLGFVQGWLTFDYAFLVVLTPLAVELSMPFICPNHQPRLRLAMERCFLAGAGFALAHLLHFGQVWAFYGSWRAALADLSESARYRAGTEQSRGVVNIIATGLSNIYLFVVSPHPIHIPILHPAPAPYSWMAFRFLGMTLGLWWVLAAIVLGGVDFGRVRRGLQPLALLRRWTAVGLIGVGVSCVWWVLMQKHTSEHPHLFYRHLMVCFVLWAIFLAVQIASLIEHWAGRLARTAAVHPSRYQSALPDRQSAGSGR